MNNLDISIYETRFPKNNVKFFNSLTTNEKIEYLYLYKKYSDIFYNYLLKKLDFAKYDNMIKTSKCNYKIVAKENLDMYQYLSLGFLNYLYLRNNIYIERLNKEELIYLNEVDVDSLSNKDFEFIENTYKKVILENNSSHSNLINYGPDNINYFKPDNIILIGVRFDEYDKNDNMSYDEWNKINNKRLIALDVLLTGFSDELDDKLALKIVFQLYNKFSVIDFNNDQSDKFQNINVN